MGLRVRIPQRHLVRLRRALLAFACLVLAAGAALLVRAARREADLAAGWAALFAADGPRARQVFAPQATDARGAAGLAVARVLGGEEGRAFLAPPVPLAPVMQAALARGDLEGCRRVAHLARAAGDPWGAAYEAAALLELGRDAEARALVEAAPAAFTGGLGGEIADVLARRAGGAQVIVRDRHGELAGTLAGGAFTPAAEAWDWIQPAAASLALRTAPAGSGLRLSLDFALSRLAREALGEYRGSIVLLDTHRGDVLVAVSDARTRGTAGSPAFEQRREPASISKLFTSTAALRAGVDPNLEIAHLTCRGSLRFPGGTLWCPCPGGPLSGLRHALAMSCNVAFAALGVKIGRQAVLEELRRFGFDGPEPWAGRIRVPDGDERQLADLSIGLEATDVTPLHAAFLASVFGHGGERPGAVLAVSDDGALGRTPHPRPRPEPRLVIDRRALPVLLAAMEGVTQPGGTAAGTAPPDFPVAMKTGTAAEPGLGYHVNYIGVGPLPDPVLAFCVRISHQPASHHASRAGREVLRRLLAALAAQPALYRRATTR